jgi:hypothetical protein
MRQIASAAIDVVSSNGHGFEIALADAPIVRFEVCGSAVLAAFGSTAVGVIPAWALWAMLGEPSPSLLLRGSSTAASAIESLPPAGRVGSARPSQPARGHRRRFHRHGVPADPDRVDA